MTRLLKFSTAPLPPSLPSPLGPRSSLLAPRPSLLAPRPSPLVPRRSPLAPRRSPLAPRPRPSPLAPRPSPLAPRRSPLAPRPSPLAPRPSPLASRPSSHLPMSRSTQRESKCCLWSLKLQLEVLCSCCYTVLSGSIPGTGPQYPTYVYV